MNARDYWFQSNFHGEDEDMEHERFSEKVARVLAHLERDPEVVQDAMGLYDQADYDRLEALEIKAHLSGDDFDWVAVVAERKRLLCAELLRRAKNAVEEEEKEQQARSADIFAEMLGGR